MICIFYRGEGRNQGRWGFRVDWLRAQSARKCSRQMGGKSAQIWNRGKNQGRWGEKSGQIFFPGRLVTTPSRVVHSPHIRVLSVKPSKTARARQKFHINDKIGRHILQRHHHISSWPSIYSTVAPNPPWDPNVGSVATAHSRRSPCPIPSSSSRPFWPYLAIIGSKMENPSLASVSSE